MLGNDERVPVSNESYPQEKDINRTCLRHTSSASFLFFKKLSFEICKKLSPEIIKMQ